MSVSANTKKEPWFGNQDAAKKHPLKNHRDKVNYVLSFTPVRHVQIGKQVQIVEATEIARVQVFTPRDYERIINPGKQAGGEGENYFQRSKTTKVRILHDPTIKAVLPEGLQGGDKDTDADAPTEGDKAPTKDALASDAPVVQKPKKKRRSSAEVAAEKAKIAAEAGTSEEVTEEEELIEEGEEEQDA